MFNLTITWGLTRHEFKDSHSNVERRWLDRSALQR